MLLCNVIFRKKNCVVPSEFHSVGLVWFYCNRVSTKFIQLTQFMAFLW